MVAILSGRRDDHIELIERLLDAPTAELGGKPRRFGVDGDSWYKVGDAQQLPDVFPAVRRLLTDKASEADNLLVAGLAKQLEAVVGRPLPLAGIDLDEFTYDSLKGCLISFWESAPLRRRALLTCRGCARVFDFTSGAGMVTDEAMLEVLGAAGTGVSRTAGKQQRLQPDLVFAKIRSPEQAGVPPYVLEQLREGSARRWRCKECDRVQRYPGSFFLSA
jgi:hypothetical protein